MRSRGFTLVELLVVVAVIALLMGIAMPLLHSSREHARTVVCATKIKQLTLGLLTYEAQNDVFPPAFYVSLGEARPANGYAGAAGNLDLPGRWWFDYSQEMNHNTGTGEEVLICPSKRQDNRLLSADPLCGNYGANLSVIRLASPYLKFYVTSFFGNAAPMRGSPSDTFLLVDSGYTLISWWHATIEPPAPLPQPSWTPEGILNACYVPGMAFNTDRVFLQGQARDAVGGRHPNKTVNVGFADGSVASKKADAMYVRKLEDGWDNGPLWKPDGDTLSSQATAP